MKKRWLLGIIVAFTMAIFPAAGSAGTCVSAMTCGIYDAAWESAADIIQHDVLQELTSNGRGWLLIDGRATAEVGELPEGNYYLGEDITIGTTIDISSAVKICLNGKVLNYSSDTVGSVFKVRKDGYLGIYDCKHTVHYFTENDVGLWAWDEFNGTNSIYGGVITGGTGDDYYGGGGAIHVTSGTVELHGGNLVGNTGSFGGAIAGTGYSGSPARIYVYGGRIVGNGPAPDSRSSDGGAIYVEGHTSYDSISNASVRHENAQVFIYGGMIDQNYSDDGGAIAGGGRITVSGGVIRDNYAKWWGGAIYSVGGTLTITGGTITNNTAKVRAGAIHATQQNDTIILSGSPYIFGNSCISAGDTANLFLNGSVIIDLGDGLSPEACIGIKPSVTDDIFTCGNGSMYMSSFVSDDPDYHIAECDNELVFEAHNFGEMSTRLANKPSCIVMPIYFAKCSECDAISQTITMEGTVYFPHDEKLIPGKDATCTESGLTDGKQCLSCGVVTVEQEIIAALGHSYTAVVTAPTCTEQGYTTYTCTTCGDSYVDDFTDVRPLNILMIGNSFSWDAADFWYDMQTSMTYDAMKTMLAEPYDVHLAVMYKGSATLGYHATCAANNTRAYTFQEIGPETNYIWEPSSGKNATNGILEHLQERDWDIIVIQSYQHEADGTQPRSTYTGGSAQFVEPSASVGFLLDYFAQNEPCAEVYYYMPWSSVKFYGADGTAAGFEGIGAYTGEHIVHMTGDSSGKKLAGIIPVGTAIENARTTYLHALNYTAGTGATALLKDPQIGLLYDSQHLSFGVGRYIAGLTVAQSLIPQEMRRTVIEWPSVKDSPAVGILPEEYSVIAQMAAEYAMQNPYEVTPIANYDADPADRVCDAIAAADYTGAGLTDEASVRVHIENIIRDLLAPWNGSDFTLTIKNCSLEDGVLWNLDAEVMVRIGYTTRTAKIFVTEGSEHRFGDWIHITAPTADSLGLDQRVCSKCGHVDSREVEGAWQKYDLTDHLQNLPDRFCAQTNLWSRLEPESVMIDHMGKWVSAGTHVYSVTIPVTPGDRIYANSFGESGSRKGIQVSFIGTYGIIKTTFSSQTYQEFTNNGGYLIAPEGAIAVNVPVWDNRSDNELYILNAGQHSFTPAVTAPTCTEQGYTTYTCTTCGDSYVDDRTEKLGHDEKLIPGKSATCTETGLTDGKQCHRCGVVTVKQEIISALGHSYGEWYVSKAPTYTEAGEKRRDCVACDHFEFGVLAALKHSYTAVVTAPTCTEDGYTTYTCTACGDSYVDDRTEKLGHDEMLIPGKSATCTESGLTDGKQCRRCGVVTVEQKIIAVLGHSYTSVVTEPTCTEGGYTTYTCTECGDSYVDDRIEKLGHDERLIPGKSATCTESGLTDGKQCRRCGVVTVEQKIIAVLGHGYTAVVTVPTCTEDGYTTYTCTTCGDSYVDDRTEKLGHDEQMIHGKVATCTETGLTDGKQCRRCGVVTVEQKIVAARGHSYEAVITKPTCTKDGYTTYTCTACGDSYVDDRTEKLGHDEQLIPGKRATCTESGLTDGKQCAICGEILVAQSVIDATGHSFTDYQPDNNATDTEDGTKTAKCDHCDATDTVVDEGTMVKHTPGKWKVTKKATCVEPGIRKTTCVDCGKTLEEVIEPHGEAVVKIPEIPATCTKNGKTAKLSCSECGKVVQQQKTIKKGHLLTELHFDESGHWYECERDDCDAVGKISTHKYDADSCEEAASCEVCGYEKPVGEHIPGKWKVSKKATCVVDGLKTATCTVCKEKLSMVIEAHGEAVEEIPETPATCTKNGKTAKLSCSECGKVVQQQKTIKKGHLLTQLHFDESGHWYECEREDCDAVGKISAHKYDVDSCEEHATCEECGYEKPVGEHIPGKWRVTKKATCVVDGLKTATCTVCKEKLSMVIEAHGEAVEEIPEIPATCTENGKTAKLSCSECGKVVQQQKTIKKGHLLTELHFDESGHWYECEREDCDAVSKTSSHRYKSGVCKVCGWEKE